MFSKNQQRICRSRYLIDSSFRTGPTKWASHYRFLSFQCNLLSQHLSFSLLRSCLVLCASCRKLTNGLPLLCSISLSLSIYLILMETSIKTKIAAVEQEKTLSCCNFLLNIKNNCCFSGFADVFISQLVNTKPHFTFEMTGNNSIRVSIRNKV